MGKEVTVDRDQSTRYAKLDSIDAKCGALLQLTSLLLVFVSLQTVQDKVLAPNPGLYRWLVIGLVVSCLFQLYALWFNEHPNDRFVDQRKWVFNTAVLITTAACLVVLFVVWRAL